MDTRVTVYSMILSVLLLRDGELVTGYPSGAPRVTCDRMQPGHGRTGSGAAPYTIDIGSKEYYSPGDIITATIRGGAFQGVLMQVRRSDGSDRGKYPPVGVFQNFPSGTRGVSCDRDDDALTHLNIENKEDLVVKWKVPNIDNLGDIHFVATVAQTKMTWWRHVKSSVIRPISAKTTAKATTTTSAPTTTAEATTTKLARTSTEMALTSTTLAQTIVTTSTSQETGGTFDNNITASASPDTQTTSSGGRNDVSSTKVTFISGAQRNRSYVLVLTVAFLIIIL